MRVGGRARKQVELRDGVASGGTRRDPVDRGPMGRNRLSAEQRAAVIEATRKNPQATQAEIARAIGISRPSVSKIEGGRRRPRVALPG